MLRYHPKYSETDPDNPAAWGTCDRCGFIWNLNKLKWQYDYRGSAMLQNLRILVCEKCTDVPQIQLTPNILSPDPAPIFNARPEPYAVDETDWFGTEPLFRSDGAGASSSDIIVTQDGDPLTLENNPSKNASTVHFVASLAKSGISLATAYLDYFNGDPASGGTSVLVSLTGSSTRTNVASQLTTVLGIAQNANFIIVTSSASAITNVNYLAVYDAPSGGNLIVSGPLAVKGPPSSVTAGAPIVFDPIFLQINTN